MDDEFLFSTRLLFIHKKKSCFIRKCTYSKTTFDQFFSSFYRVGIYTWYFFYLHFFFFFIQPLNSFFFLSFAVRWRDFTSCASNRYHGIRIITVVQGSWLKCLFKKKSFFCFESNENKAHFLFKDDFQQNDFRFLM